jgi:hypothetical protein
MAASPIILKQEMMMNKTAFTISTVLTTFILVAVASMVYAVRAADKPQVAAVEATATMEPAAPEVPTEDLNQALLQTFAKREAQYQATISEANARLEALQKQQAALQGQLSGQPTAATPEEVTPEQAATIAAEYLGQYRIYSIELVVLSGENIYQVTFSTGDMVYISMDGQVTGSFGATYGPSLRAGVSSGQTQSGTSTQSTPPPHYEDDDDDDDD